MKQHLFEQSSVCNLWIVLRGGQKRAGFVKDKTLRLFSLGPPRKWRALARPVQTGWAQDAGCQNGSVPFKVKDAEVCQQGGEEVTATCPGSNPWWGFSLLSPELSLATGQQLSKLQRTRVGDMSRPHFPRGFLLYVKWLLEMHSPYYCLHYRILKCTLK